MNANKPYWFVVLILTSLALLLSSCGGSNNPTPTIFTPGCDTNNLITDINTANASFLPAIIELDPGCTYPLTHVDNSQPYPPGLWIKSGLPAITSEITIKGNNAILLVAPSSGQDDFGHFFVSAEGDLEIYDLTLREGRRIHGGAVFVMNGQFLASNTQFIANQALGQGNDTAGRGGALFNHHGRVWLIAQTHFIDNEAVITAAPQGGTGGAIYNRNGAMTIYNTNFTTNRAIELGGAIHTYRAGLGVGEEMILINGCQFDGNTAKAGGAIYADGEVTGFIITASHFSNNLSMNYGGSMVVASSHLQLGYSTFEDNESYDYAGVILARGSKLAIESSMFVGNTALECGVIEEDSGAEVDISGSTFSNNSATQSFGGAICHVDGVLVIDDSEFISNSTVKYGGGVYATDAVEINASQFISNTAELGAGLFIGSHSQSFSQPPQMDFNASVTQSTFTSNHATYHGGGIFFNGEKDLYVDQSTFNFNVANGFAGGIFHDWGRLYLTNSTLSNNAADVAGGGIWDTGCHFTGGAKILITHTTVAYNNSAGVEGLSYYGGGGANLSGDVTIKNSLFAFNGYKNCVLYKNCIQYTGQGSMDTDQTCKFAHTVSDPLIGPLADNGGSTQTHALLPGSPAIDLLASCAGLSEDQRGVTRPQGAACDVGSYEDEAAEVLPPPPPPEEEPSPCGYFEEQTPTLMLLSIPVGTTEQTLYLAITGDFPGSGDADLDGEETLSYYAILGRARSEGYFLREFPNRVYFDFELSESVFGTVQPLEVYVEGCQDPIFTHPWVTIFPPPDWAPPKTECIPELNEPNCEAAGGTYSCTRGSGCVCTCPD